MLGMNRRLAELEENGTQILAAIIGAGQMGTGMVSQMLAMKGMRPAVVADINIESARKAYLHAGISEDQIVAIETAEEGIQAIEDGKFVITNNAMLAPKITQIDAVVEATGVPDVGAHVAMDCIFEKKNIIMMNVEADVTIGPLLKKLADNAGIVYTGSHGDEPGAVMELYDFATALGYDVRVVGKGKNNKLDFNANPDSVLEEATRRGVSPKMLACFKDGTKTMVEMTAMSNATGFLPDVRGAHGPAGTVDELPSIFQLKEEGGILNGYGKVDFVNGVAPGVFVIVSSPLKEVHREMHYLSMGDGPNYVLYRPYHLCSLETPLTVARAVLDREPTIVPLGAPISECVTVAKIDLKAGQMLDGIGGYTVYGTIEIAEVAKQEKAVPLGLINRKTKLIRDVKKGELVTYNDIELDTDSFIVQLRQLQDQLF
jgi:predicted homoserine dehydrogenase-like protein